MHATVYVVPLSDARLGLEAGDQLVLHPDGSVRLVRDVPWTAADLERLAMTGAIIPRDGDPSSRAA